jgi:hypothetical protein
LSQNAALVGLTLISCALPACPPSQPAARWTVVAQSLREGLLSVHGRSATDVWAVGADKGSGSLVLHYDGTQWERRSTGTHGSLWWVHAAQDGTTWMSGTGSTILRVRNGTYERMPTPGLARHTIFGIWSSNSATTPEVYAVGSEAGRSGFLWKFDGTRVVDVNLGAALPTADDGTTPGLFKVWGDNAGAVWVVGGRGVVLRGRNGMFERVESGATNTLFTVTGDGRRVVVVGGAGQGTLIEREGDAAFVSRTPDAAGLLQAVALRGDGTGVAAGFNGAVYLRSANGAWAQDNMAPSLPIESLHAAWIDDEGGAWFVGGGILGPALDRGAVTYRGRRMVPTYSESAMGDGGVSDGGDASMPAAVCPEAQVDPAPMGSVARRWNEALLWAIRRDIPKPVVHARNLFHTSAAMWDAWAAYDATADGVFFRERKTAMDVAAARREAISYAAFRVLSARYAPTLANGAAVSQA